MKKQVSIVTALYAVAILVAHLIASHYGWYETRLHFDKYMHFFGGAFIFFTFVMLLFRHAPIQFTGRQLYVLVLFVLVVGLLWEAFEYIVQHFTGVIIATIPDSIGDLVFDTFGALIAAFMMFFVQYPKKRYNTYNAER